MLLSFVFSSREASPGGLIRCYFSEIMDLRHDIYLSSILISVTCEPYGILSKRFDPLSPFIHPVFLLITLIVE